MKCTDYNTDYLNMFDVVKSEGIKYKVYVCPTCNNENFEEIQDNRRGKRFNMFNKKSNRNSNRNKKVYTTYNRTGKIFDEVLTGEIFSCRM